MESRNQALNVSCQILVGVGRLERQLRYVRAKFTPKFKESGLNQCRFKVCQSVVAHPFELFLSPEPKRTDFSQ